VNTSLRGRSTSISDDITKLNAPPGRYLDPAAFPADFAADLPPAQATFMAHSQAMLAKAAGGAPVTARAQNGQAGRQRNDRGSRQPRGLRFQAE
jgi:hypothetical protein